jgi:hypothetical protein
VAIVRVRTAERCEVPTYRAGKGLLGTTKNLFRWLHATDPNGALYLSTSGMEASAIKYLKNPDSRLEHGRQSAWSNRALEIAVLHAGNESPDTIAYLVHRLRRRWPYINIDTTLPAPLQFAFKSKEYALGLAEEEDEVDVEETTDVAF